MWKLAGKLSRNPIPISPSPLHLTNFLLLFVYLPRFYLYTSPPFPFHHSLSVILRYAISPSCLSALSCLVLIILPSSFLPFLLLPYLSFSLYHHPFPFIFSFFSNPTSFYIVPPPPCLHPQPFSKHLSLFHWRTPRSYHISPSHFFRIFLHLILRLHVSFATSLSLNLISGFFLSIPPPQFISPSLLFVLGLVILFYTLSPSFFLTISSSTFPFAYFRSLVPSFPPSLYPFHSLSFLPLSCSSFLRLLPVRSPPAGSPPAFHIMVFSHVRTNVHFL